MTITMLSAFALTGCDSKLQEQAVTPAQVQQRAQDFTTKQPIDTTGKPMKLGY